MSESFYSAATYKGGNLPELTSDGSSPPTSHGADTCSAQPTMPRAPRGLAMLPGCICSLLCPGIDTGGSAQHLL